MSRASWWARKVRQFRSHLGASVSAAERSALATWLTPDQLGLFDTMHIADRRHGLEVVASLRAAGVSDPDVLLAGLLHDAAKGVVGVGPRVAYSLGQAYGRWVWRLASIAPGYRTDLARLRDHPAASAALAAGVGCSARTVALIADQDAPRDPEFGELLRLADEAN